MVVSMRLILHYYTPLLIVDRKERIWLSQRGVNHGKVQDRLSNKENKSLL